jgi:hypothetical protein
MQESYQPAASRLCGCRSTCAIHCGGPRGESIHPVYECLTPILPIRIGLPWLDRTRVRVPKHAKSHISLAPPTHARRRRAEPPTGGESRRRVTPSYDCVTRRLVLLCVESS